MQTAKEKKRHVGRPRLPVDEKHRTFTVSMPPDLRKRFDEEIAPYGSSRSRVINLLIEQWLEANKHEKLSFMRKFG